MSSCMSSRGSLVRLRSALPDLLVTHINEGPAGVTVAVAWTDPSSGDLRRANFPADVLEPVPSPPPPPGSPLGVAEANVAPSA